jgi:hypothetical protein
MDLYGLYASEWGELPLSREAAPVISTGLSARHGPDQGKEPQ